MFLPVILCACVAAAHAQQSYLAPTLIEAGNVVFPNSGPPVAAISLLAAVDPDGHVSETQTVDSVGSTPSGEAYAGTLAGYVNDSIAAAKQWRFSPAVDLRRKPTRSTASITFVYQTVFDRGADTTIIPSLETSSRKADEYQPPLAGKVSRVEYPLRGFIQTPSPTVVLNLQIEADGSISTVDVIQSVPALNALAVRDVKNFQFRAARYEGKPIRSTAIVAFVFLRLTN